MLDSVQEGLAALAPRLSQRDKDTLDGYLSSVREVEQRIVRSDIPGCTDRAPPPFVDLKGGAQFVRNQAPYSREQHAQLMNDLVVLALSCDATRVVSYLLDDENSHFVYDHVPGITLTETGASVMGGPCGEYAAAHEAASEGYTSISYWLVQKVSQLCQSLAQVPDVGGATLLDNTVVFFGAGTHGTSHACADLPAILIGGGSSRLSLNRHLQLQQRPLRDLYFTLLNGVFELGVSDFGVNLTGAPPTLIEELLP